MCGIISYIGPKQALPVLVQGLKDLEYRGYDSGGLMINHNGKLYVRKAAGDMDKLSAKLAVGTLGNAGLAHNRWATHGEANEINAHPHSDCDGKIWVVHNGIIENYRELKDFLRSQGHSFRSDTDTEVLPHLIEHYLARHPADILLAFKCALASVKGAYGVAMMHQDHPDRMWLARQGSPLILGVGRQEMVAASDLKAISRITDQVVFLEDGDIFEVTADKYLLFRNGSLCEAETERIEMPTEAGGPDKYPHQMLREIMEQPNSMADTLRGRLLPRAGRVKLGGLELAADRLRHINKLTIVACGTAYNAGLVGKYWLEDYGRIEVDVELASEFRYREKLWRPDSAILAISQSGETADTLEAVKAARDKGILTLGIVNAVKSSIARLTDAGVYNHIGPETAVASTKAFISQLAVLAMLAVFFGQERGTDLKKRQKFVAALADLPEQIRTALADTDSITVLARSLAEQRSFMFMGRLHNYPLALEGALKLKELAYVFAEGYASGEMKHGPIALVDGDMISVFLCPRDQVYEKNISNLREIEARGGRIIAVTDGDDPELESLAETVVKVPAVHPALSPVINAIPLQLLAYYSAAQRGHNVDKPRNLAKSVTVE